jgi:hypothetical protein
MGYTINSTADYHIRNINTLGWELTVCNALHNPKSPCRGVLRRDASYGNHLYDFLESFMPVSRFTRIMEIGGGYGTLMKDFFVQKETIKATMMDISPLLLAEQKKTLAGFDVRYVLADFLDADAKFLQDQELIIMNENLGDFPTYLDIDRDILSDLPQDRDVPMRKVHRLFKTYSLDTPLLSPFHFNTGAIEAIEKLCRSQVPFIFVGEHSCEATVPDKYQKLIRISASGNPERISLKGHDEYTICFSNLVKVASFFNYRVLRGPFADFLPFELTDRLRSVMSAPSAISDEGEIIRHFIEDLYLYEYLILIREKNRI